MRRLPFGTFPLRKPLPPEQSFPFPAMYRSNPTLKPNDNIVDLDTKIGSRVDGFLIRVLSLFQFPPNINARSSKYRGDLGSLYRQIKTTAAPYFPFSFPFPGKKHKRQLVYVSTPPTPVFRGIPATGTKPAQIRKVNARHMLACSVLLPLHSPPLVLPLNHDASKPSPGRLTLGKKHSLVRPAP